MHPRGAYAQDDRRLLRKPCWEIQRLARASFVRRLEVKDIGFHAVGLQGLGFRGKPYFPPTRVKGYLPHIPSKQKTTRAFCPNLHIQIRDWVHRSQWGVHNILVPRRSRYDLGYLALPKSCDF